MKTKTLALLLAFLAISCANTEPKKDEIIRKIKIARVQMDQPFLKSEFSGIIREGHENKLAFRVAGPILNIYVKEGSYVKEGDLIAEIDPRDYQTQYNVANAQYTQVKAETDRVVEMYNRKSVPDNDCEKAVAGEKLVTAQLSHAENQLRDTKLYAPFAGYIQEINFQKGEMINAGMPLATLINLDLYKIEVDIPASVYVSKNDFTSFTCMNAETGTDELPLKLLSYTAKADNNQLYKLYFSLDPGLNKNLAPGMNVKVFIYRTNPETGSLVVPVESVFFENDDACVWIYNSMTQKVMKRKVITGELAENGTIKITSGLTSNECVVTAGVNSLEEDQKVRVLNQVSETNIGGLL
jgi:RND family efflux transporter MFP subunit